MKQRVKKIVKLIVLFSLSIVYGQALCQVTGNTVVHAGDIEQYTVQNLPPSYFIKIEGGRFAAPQHCAPNALCSFVGTTFQVAWDSNPSGIHTIEICERRFINPPGHYFLDCGTSPALVVTMVSGNLVVGPIEGDSTACQGRTYTYHVEEVASAEEYRWSITGGSILSGQNTNTITASWNTGSTEGELTVFPWNRLEGNGTPSTIKVYIYPPLSSPVKNILFSDSNLTTTAPQSLTIGHCSNDVACVQQRLVNANLVARLDLGENYNYGQNNFNTEVEFVVSAYGSYVGNNSIVLKDTFLLRINQDTPEQLARLDITEKYSGIGRIDIEIKNYVPHALVRSGLRFQVYYEDVFKSDVKSLAPTPITLNPVVTSPSGTNKLTFSWNNSCVDFPDYEFQLLRLYNNDPTRTNNSRTIRSRIDWGQALTVETQSSNTSLTISVAEGSGYYVWRVRPIGGYYEGGIANPKNWGPWSAHGNFTQGQELAVSQSISPYSFYYTQFDENINWIYSRNFKEGDVDKSVPVRISEQIDFANGLNQVKQSQTVLESAQAAVVSQRVYDFTGWPSLLSKAVPVAGKTSLGYVPSFMKNESNTPYSAADFDGDLNYNQPGTVKDDTPADQFNYYSNTNTDINIASAQGYPFSRIRYYGDGTGRIKEQSSAGSVHTIKASPNESRTMKTYYSGVTDDELIRVFGDEAPSAESVQKVITLDPNRVATVKYVGKDGKVVATCLDRNGANDIDDPDAVLKGLASQQQAGFTVTDTLSENTPWTDFGNQRSRRLDLTKPTAVALNYNLEPANIQDVCSGYCNTCDYYLEFSINDVEDPEVTIMEHHVLLPPNLCASQVAFQYDTLVQLDAGSYVISRRIRAANATAQSTSNTTYLAEQMDSVRQHYRAVVQSSMGTAQALLNDPSRAIDEVYRSLGVETNIPNAEFAFLDSLLTVTVGCDTIEIPVLVCATRRCPPEWSFERYLLSRFEIELDPSLILSTIPQHFEDYNENYSDGEFDRLVENMISDGYSCDSLWNCWDRIVQNYETLRERGQTDSTYSFDPVEEFLTCAGRRLEGFSNTAMGDAQNPGYRSHAYKIFQYTPGANAACESVFSGSSGTVDFTTFTPDQWQSFYLCVQANGHPMAAVFDPVNKSIEMSDSCRVYCESRRTSFEQAIITMFHNDSLYVEGDAYELTRDSSWGQTFVENTNEPLPVNFSYDVNRTEVLCMASSLVNQCQSGCTLTPQYNTQGNLVSIGTGAEIQAITESLTYTFEVDLQENGICRSGFDRIEAGDSVVLSGTLGLGRRWDFTFGTSSANSSTLWDMQRTQDGGFILAGNSDGNSGSDKSENSRGRTDYWIIKLDEDGNKIWDVTIGGTQEDRLSSLRQTQDGGYILGGTSSSGQGGDKNSSNFGASDYWLVKLDAQGQLQWEMSYGGNQNDELVSVQETADGGYILGGNSSSDISGNKTLAWLGSANRAFMDYWIIKVDSQGNIEWQKVYGSAGSEHLHSVRQTSEGEYIVGGYSNGNQHPAGGKTENNLGQNDYWVIKLDNLGNREWDNTIGGAKSDVLYDLEVTRDGGFILGGYSMSSQGFDKSENGFGNGDIWVVKVNASGSISWEKTFGGTRREFSDDIPLLDVMQTADGGFLVGGISNSDQGGDKSENSYDNPAGPPADLDDFWLIKLNSNGSKEWDKTVGGMASDFITALDEIGNDQFVVAGYSNSPNNFLPACGNQCDQLGWKSRDPLAQFDYWIAKLGPEVCDHRDFCFQWKPLLQPDNPPAFIPYTCSKVNKDEVKSIVDNQVYDLIEGKVVEYERNYNQQCADPENINDKFWLSYPLGYHHYTLYYRDRSGNLIKTVPPKGVQVLDLTDRRVRNKEVAAFHTLVTQYHYNSLQQLVRQFTPDGGETHFYYNNLGQLRFSQNPRQKRDSVYSYTRYDRLGRVVEVGESNDSIQAFMNKGDDDQFPLQGFQKTLTVYSQPADSAFTEGWVQRYLTNRISYMYTDEGAYTVNSYDPHGNVEWTMHQVPGLNRIMRIAYEYDLTSRNVLKVKYNEGREDQFLHRYSYDADSRITKVETSADNVIWDADAQYEYYRHGPLKRTALGEDKLQGIDHTYTINGWLKGINYAGTDPTKDPGADGAVGSHSEFARDAFGMQLGYYTGDFDRTGSSFHSGATNALNPETNRNLYNGNVSTWSSYLSPPDSLMQRNDVTGWQFTYDELNRIAQSDFKTHQGNNWGPSANDYRSTYQYDANGNITGLVRNGNSATLPMDNLSYTYQSQTNRLTQVSDNIPDNHYSYDLDGVNTYTYDAIGNLIRDPKEEIDSIEWTVYGKAKKIIRTASSAKPHLEFIYDASGNRAAKKAIPDRRDSAKTKTTYYISGPDGNVLAIYKKVMVSGKERVTLIENPIYGATRLGERTVSIPINISEGPHGGAPGNGGNDPARSIIRLLAQRASGASLIDMNLLKEADLKIVKTPSLGTAGKNISYASDENGNVLFTAYTAREYDSKTNIFLALDKENKIIPGSEKIISDWRRKSITLRNPSDTLEYYLFTLSPEGLPYYHLIDTRSYQIKRINQPLDSKSGYGFGMALIDERAGKYPSALYLANFNRGTTSLIRFSINASGISKPAVLEIFESDGAEVGREMQISSGGQQLALAVPSAKGLTSTIYIFDLREDHQEATLKRVFKSDKNVYISSLDFSPSGKSIYYNSDPSEGPEGIITSIHRLDLETNKDQEILKSTGEIRRNDRGTMFIASELDNTLYEVQDPDQDGDVTPYRINEIIGNEWRLQDALSIRADLKVRTTFPGPGPGQPPVTITHDSLIYTRQIGSKWYELTDHLGNVRSVISDIKASTITGGQPGNFKAIVREAYQYYPYGMIMPYWIDADSVVHLATLEDNKVAQEQADFAASYAQATKISGNLFNHTKEVGANKSLRLTGAEGAMVGLGKTLEVAEGDTIKLEAYAKYFAPSETTPATHIVAQMFQALTTEFGVTPGLDGGRAFQTFNELFAGNLLFPGKGNDDEVKGYLNYLLFDKQYNLIDAGYKAMSQAASEDGSNVSHDRLKLEVIASQGGYLYAYLSNESNRITDIYFDDFKITHVTGTLADEKVAYRYGFNGMEKDDEVKQDGNSYTTFWRQYDPRVGRWMSIDPEAKKFVEFSPYVAFNNNPITFADPSGDESEEEAVRKSFTDHLDAQGIDYAEEVKIRVKVDTKIDPRGYVEGRMDLIYKDPNTGGWNLKELKGDAWSPLTDNQELYHPALGEGGEWEIIGDGKKGNAPLIGLRRGTKGKGNFGIVHSGTLFDALKKASKPTRRIIEVITKRGGKIIKRAAKVAPLAGFYIGLATYPLEASAAEKEAHEMDMIIGEIPVAGSIWDIGFIGLELIGEEEWARQKVYEAIHGDAETNE